MPRRTMRSVTLGTLRHERRRYLSSVVAIVLGVAFVAATLALSASLAASVRANIAGDLSRYALVVTPGDRSTGPDASDAATSGAPRSAQGLSAAQLAAVAAVPGVTGVEPQRITMVTAAIPGGGQAQTMSGTWPKDPAASRVTLTAGAAPTTPDQVVLSSRTAAGLSAAPGAKIALATPDGTPREVTITGIADTGQARRTAGFVGAFGTDELLTALTNGQGAVEADVTAAPGTSPEALRTAVAGALASAGPAVTVRTASAAVDAQVRQALGGTEILTYLLLGFAAVAVFVAALVIANTFSIVVASRTRTLALLRCVGADRSQVRRSVLAESAVIGAVGSLAGLAVGVGFAGLVVALAARADLGIPLDTLAVDPTTVLTCLGLGIVVTVLAAALPARRATRVAPLAALRDDAAPTTASTAGRARVVAALVLTAGGFAMLVIGALGHTFALAVAGGVVSFLGILVGGVFIVPALVRLVGRTGVVGRGPVARLAAQNAGRNPSRAAATCAALLVGVGLITMMSVGAASAQRSLDSYLTLRDPVDAVVAAGPTPLADTTVSRSTSISGVVASAQVRSTPGTLTAGTSAGSAPGSPSSSATGSGGAPVSVSTIDPDQLARVSRSTSLVATVLGSADADDRVILSPSEAKELGLHEGSRVTVAGSGTGAAQAPLTVALLERSTSDVLVTPATWARLSPQATGEVSQVLLRFADGVDPGPLLDQVQGAAGATAGAQVSGAAAERHGFEQVMSIALAVVTGLLAIAVLIALVGVANTLSLSVLERTREAALLRALGLTRRQLRSMVSREAVLLALVATALGLVLGSVYGWAAAQSLLGGSVAVSLDVPWLRLLAVAAVAVGAGAIAALVPARMATRAQPAQALTAD